MLTTKNNSQCEIEINKSRFLGFVYRVECEQDVESFINELKRKHKDAKHIVYAYKIYPNITKKENSSEPAGTAGAPILSAIEKQGLCNVLVVVVRYFGGVLLGASNLLRAYSNTAIMCLEKAGKLEVELYDVYKTHISYNELNTFEQLVGKDKVLTKEFSNGIMIEFACNDVSKLKSYNLKKCEGSVWL